MNSCGNWIRFRMVSGTVKGLRAVLIGPGIAKYFRFEMKKIGFGSSYLSPGSQISKKKFGSEDKNLQIVLDLSQDKILDLLLSVGILQTTPT
jgi:hypothetical protein